MQVRTPWREVGKRMQVRVHIEFLWKRDHAQAIVRAAQVHVLCAEQRSICFETKAFEQPLQTGRRQSVVTVGGKYQQCASSSQWPNRSGPLAGVSPQFCRVRFRSQRGILYHACVLINMHYLAFESGG